MRVASGVCILLAAAVACLPLLRVGEYGANSLCLPMPTASTASPRDEASSAGFSVTVVLLNSLCYLVMTATHVRLHCRQGGSSKAGKGGVGGAGGGGLAEDCLDCCWVKHAARLLFTNCLLFFPVAFLSFAGLLNFGFVSAEVVKSIVLVVGPLPACMNPLLYMLLNPHFKEDLGYVCSPLKSHRWSCGGRCCRLAAGREADVTDKSSSCDSTQSLVTESSEAPNSAWPSQQSLACSGGDHCPLSHC